MNAAAERLSGYQAQHARGKNYTHVLHFTNAFHEEHRDEPAVEAALKKGTIQQLPTHTALTARNKQKIPITGTVTPLRVTNNAQGKIIGCMVVCRESTRERELEQAKDDFISIAAHQLRTPLGSIRWNTEMMLAGDLGEMSIIAREALQQVFDSNEHMIVLVNDLLKISRLDQAFASHDPQYCNVLSIIKDAVDELRPLIQKQQVHLDLQSSQGQVARVFADRKHLREVIQNLLSNAIKYNQRGGTVAVRFQDQQQTLFVSIHDTGMGIPKKDLRRLFSKFFRAENAVRSETEGSGLGLFVVQSYVEAWGGTIWCESDEGNGATFTFTVPLHPHPLRQMDTKHH